MIEWYRYSSTPIVELSSELIVLVGSKVTDANASFIRLPWYLHYYQNAQGLLVTH